MKLLIAGGRNITNEADIRSALYASCWLADATEIVHGACPTGVDAFAHRLFDGVLPVMPFPANWKDHGRAAGPIRNAEMAAYADRLILIWDGKSRGSASMLREMQKVGKPVFQHIVSGDQVTG